MAKIPEGSRVLAVVGSRDFPDESMVRQWMQANVERFDYLVTGGANGVDTWAEEEWTRLKGKENLRVFKADWKKYKGAAGMIRNLRLLSEATFAAVFWHHLSPGSLDDVGLVFANQIPANVYVR